MKKQLVKHFVLQHTNYLLKQSLLNVKKLVVKSMKAKEIRELTTAEIEVNVKEMKEELFNLRFQLATGQLENTARIKDVKRSIARLKTVVRERELSINN